ncbi:MAG: hypothetical protein ACQETP_01060, partial [Bacteroidota bacterium]
MLPSVQYDWGGETLYEPGTDLLPCVILTPQAEGSQRRPNTLGTPRAHRTPPCTLGGTASQLH